MFRFNGDQIIYTCVLIVFEIYLMVIKSNRYIFRNFKGKKIFKKIKDYVHCLARKKNQGKSREI
jgi:hypothetical protein